MDETPRTLDDDVTITLSDPQATPAFETARRRRADLHRAIVEVEGAISSPAPGRLPEWTAEVAAAFEHLRRSFHEHVAGTEEPGGLYDDITDRAPHLSGKIARLRREHPVITESIDGCVERLRTPPPDDDALDELRDDIQRVLGKIVRHRQHGADLVWEAYNLDIGGQG